VALLWWGVLWECAGEGIGVGGVVARSEEGDGDGELGGEEEREVGQAGPGERCMSAGKAAEAVIEVAAWIPADARVNEEGAIGEGSANDVFADVGEVGITSGE
jgi:hypothetical protein